MSLQEWKGPRSSKNTVYKDEVCIVQIITRLTLINDVYVN